MEQKLSLIIWEIKNIQSNIASTQLTNAMIWATLGLIVMAAQFWPGVNRQGFGIVKDLTGLQIIDTEVIPCGEEGNGVIEWTNDTGENIYIASVNIWMGMYMGSKSDFAVWLQRHGRESTLVRSNWDHYADPTAPAHYLEKNYAPHHVTVKPDESLALHYSCSNIDNSNAHGHATVMIWYYQ